ncbi:hypothetical protein DPMN_013294 [Dreissena polymorpha]|uniref:Uncharacterized protein n=1 Tax=Dreissena polymorpha TaxID=45954 RepID=A0A9D4S3N4_DREPO|nr:hypothetical protein DPMN_013294 [Dreissena polymorpha]
MNVDAEISLDQSHVFNISLPVLDLSDPASLLELISSGYQLMENEDDNSFPEIEIPLTSMEVLASCLCRKNSKAEMKPKVM